jgi:hypothetical protein
MSAARNRVARAFGERHLDVCNLTSMGVDIEDLMKAHGDEFLEEADIVLQAAGFDGLLATLTQLCFVIRTGGDVLKACEGAEALIGKTMGGAS